MLIVQTPRAFFGVMVGALPIVRVHASRLGKLVYLPAYEAGEQFFRKGVVDLFAWWGGLGMLAYLTGFYWVLDLLSGASVASLRSFKIVARAGRGKSERRVWWGLVGRRRTYLPSSDDPHTT